MSCQRARPDAVAEPLVREFVGDEPLLAAVAVDVVRAEDREPLRLERDLELVGGDDDRVPLERVGPEALLEHLEHARQRGEVGAHRALERTREVHRRPPRRRTRAPASRTGPTCTMTR